MADLMSVEGLTKFTCTLSSTFNKPIYGVFLGDATAFCWGGRWYIVLLVAGFVFGTADGVRRVHCVDVVHRVHWHCVNIRRVHCVDVHCVDGVRARGDGQHTRGWLDSSIIELKQHRVNLKDALVTVRGVTTNRRNRCAYNRIACDYMRCRRR